MRVAVRRWSEQFGLPSSSLSTARQLYALTLLTAFWPEWMWVPDFGQPFYQPPTGLASFFADPIPHAAVLALNAIGITASVCLLAGRGVQMASVVVSTVLWVGNSFEYSYGKVDHDVLLLLTPLAGAAAGWDGRRETRAWPLAIFALAIALSMTASGIDKAATGWLDPQRGAVRSHMTFNSIVVGRDAPLADTADVFPPLVWEAFDWGAVILEVAFLGAVLRARWFRGAIALVCLFHAANIALFLIPFYANVVAYALFVRWPREWRWKAPASLAILGSAVATAVYLAWGNPLHLQFRRVGLDPYPYLWTQSVVVMLGAILAVVWIVACSGAFMPRVRISPETSPGPRVIAFDGHCGLCNGWVDFIMRRDRRRVWRFTPLQSPAGSALAAPGQSGDLSSVVVVRDGWRYTRSTGVIIAVGELGGPWRLALLLLAVPAPVRDVFYRIVAKWRYRIFGRSETCRLPTPEERERFI